MGQSLNKASLARRAIRLAWGHSEPGSDIQRALESSDATVLRFYRRNEAALAGPMQNVLEDEFHIKEGNSRVPLRIQRLYMHLDGVLEGRTDQRDEHLERVASRIKELL